jgi:hypothetical protein
MKILRKIRRLVVASMLVVWPMTAVYAAEPEAGRNPAMDSQAMVVLKQATTFLTRQPRLFFRAEVTQDVVQASGLKLQFNSTVEATVRRPDRLAGTRTLDNGTVRKFWYDGKLATLFDAAENVYAQTTVPENIDAMLDYLETVVEAPQPLADLLYSDLTPLLELPTEALYVGKSYISGAACDHLAFRGKNLDWQVWVRQGDEPLIQKFIITYKSQPGAPQYTAVMTDWRFPQQVADAAFQFQLPQGAQKIKMVVSPKAQSMKGGLTK